MRRRLTSLLITASLLLGAPFGAMAGNLEPWQLRHIAAPPQEYLLYRLAYRGIFTAFAWKDLADVAFTVADHTQTFQGQSSCDMRMRLSTENYTLAEVMRPTRYQWRSLADPDLERVYLVDVSDLTSDERERRVSWVDWSHRSIELFRLRERKPVYSSPFFDDEDSLVTGYTWEPDGAKPVPAFLNDEPLIEGRYTPLVYDKSVALEDGVQHLLDPLSFIYAARWHDYGDGDLVRPITYKDEIRYYRAQFSGRETLTIGNTDFAALRVEMQRTRLEDAADEGFMRVWFSDDERRTPLKFIIDAKVGKMRVHIVPATIIASRRSRPCLSAAPPPASLTAQDADEAAGLAASAP